MCYNVSWKTTGYYRKDSLKLAACCPVSGCWPSRCRILLQVLRSDLKSMTSVNKNEIQAVIYGLYIRAVITGSAYRPLAWRPTAPQFSRVSKGLGLRLGLGLVSVIGLVWDFPAWSRILRPEPNMQAQLNVRVRINYAPTAPASEWTMHRPCWPHRPYTVYMAILYTKQRTVNCPKC